jgi:VWFA-related protein
MAGRTVTHGRGAYRLILACCAWQLLALLLFPSPLGAQEVPFRDAVVVERVVLEARALDPAGEPLLGLARQDFLLLVDDTPVQLESAEWIAEQGSPLPGSVARAGGQAAPPQKPPQRIVILYFQTDFHPSRLSGLMRLGPRIAALIESLNPNDLVAVVCFDSHLKLQVDLTTDREALRRAILPTALFRQPGLVQPAGEPSLAAHLDPARALGAATPEAALALTAQALEAIPGVKSLVYVGWGLGRFSPSGVRLPPAYFAAAAALSRARTTVFVLDVTDADYHSLELGLQQVAADTGGFYARTHLFPILAVQRLANALVGYYELVFEKPHLPHGRHRIQVRLANRRGTVITRPVYSD